jgi:hypothetical protein
MRPRPRELQLAAFCADVNEVEDEQPIAPAPQQHFRFSHQHSPESKLLKRDANGHKTSI